MSHIPHPRRIAAAFAALAAACLGLAVTASAAFAQVPGSPGYQALPASLVRQALLQGEDLGPVSGTGTAQSGALTVTRTIVVGGMPGWQIALIAAGAALLTATLAVVADRARAAHRKTAPAS
jgi:hypothetical protein